MIDKSKYTHTGLYYGIKVYYNQFQLGDEWLHGANHFTHLAVMIMFILDHLLSVEFELSDLKEL